MINQAELKHAFEYDLITGVFKNKIHRNSRARKGAVSGCLAPIGYTLIYFKGKLHYRHRLAWLYVTGSFPKNEIDHVDHDTNNDAFANLREVTHTENGQNMRKHKSNTSGCTGVHFSTKAQKWIAKIEVDTKQITGGSYFDYFEAVCARKSLELKHNFHPNHGR